MQSVEKVFLIITLFFGLIFALINPPFQSPDEPEHLFKMFGYTKGVFKYQVLDGRTGLIMPESFLKLKNMYGYLPFNYYAATSPEILKYASKIKLEPEKTIFVPHNPTSYLPISYFPIAIFMQIFIWLKLPPLIILFLLRITELFLYTGLMWLAIRITPIKKWLFAFLGILPMAVYIASSVNTDPWVIGLSVVLCAYFLKLAYDGAVEKISIKQIGIVSILLFVITLCKLAYLPLALLFFIIPKGKFLSRFERLKYFLLVIFSGIIAFNLFIWYGMVNFGDIITISELQTTDSCTNLIEHIVLHPLYYLQKIHATLYTLYPIYFSTFIARFGWLDTFLPPLFIKIYWLILIFAAFAISKEDEKLKIKFSDRLIFFVIVYLSFILICLSGFLTFKQLVPYIPGVQGRYFYPIAPVIFMIFANNTLKVSEKFLKNVIVITSVIGLSVSVYFIILRFYMTAAVQMWY